MLKSHRIVVATVSSMASKLDLLHFNIDEASQILEPAILGLLPLFERFILIGDHQQLPAVVVQSSEASNITDTELEEIGLNNLRNSLFERLYKRCKLKVLPEETDRYAQQVASIGWSLPESPSPMETMLSRQRVLFLPTPSSAANGNHKTNKYEAERIAELIVSFQNIYKENNKDFTKNSLGIITPYRAQIAQIKRVLQEQNISDELLTIDTVERYQGGARDVILLSLCANHMRQLKSLISHSDEGVDRKLNVALTRAREHLVILGNAEVLRTDEVYRELIDYGRPSTRS